jgi:hypothetical protein
MGYKIFSKEKILAKTGHSRYWYLLTAFKDEKFECLGEELLDFYQVGYQYAFQPEDYRKSNRAVLMHLKSRQNPDE